MSARWWSVARAAPLSWCHMSHKWRLLILAWGGSLVLQIVLFTCEGVDLIKKIISIKHFTCTSSETRAASQIAYCIVGTFGLKQTSRLLKKYVLYSINVCSMNKIWMYKIHHVVTAMSCCIASPPFKKSFPAASWDSKVSIECTSQNPGGSSRSPRHFSPTVFRHTALLAYSFFAY